MERNRIRNNIRSRIEQTNLSQTREWRKQIYTTVTHAFKNNPCLLIVISFQSFRLTRLSHTRLCIFTYAVRFDLCNVNRSIYMNIDIYLRDKFFEETIRLFYVCLSICLLNVKNINNIHWSYIVLIFFFPSFSLLFFYR